MRDRLSPTQREILSGLSAGCITTAATHPLDILKIRLQLDQASKTQYESFSKVLKTFTSNNSINTIRQVYRGVIPNLIGSSFAWSVYFASYRYFKDLSHFYVFKSTGFKKDSNLQSWNYLTSAFAAGTFTAVITNPFWVLKTRILSTSKDTPGAYKGFINGIVRIFKEEGISGFYKGLLPSLVGVSQGAFQFTIYDTLKYQIMQDSSHRGKLEIYEYILMSCVSKILSTLITYPCQLLRSRLQDYSSINEKKTIDELIKKIYLLEGINGFYKGIIPNLIRVLPATCITFGVYETIKKIA